MVKRNTDSAIHTHSVAQQVALANTEATEAIYSLGASSSFADVGAALDVLVCHGVSLSK
jgi:hypothetical protein